MKPITLVFSTGRSGTTLLATLLSRVHGSYAENNYEMIGPDNHGVDQHRFSSVRGKNKIDPSIGHKFVGQFLERVKNYPCQHFTYCGSEILDGFIEHFWSYDVYPNVIILRRNPRDVAISLLLLGWAPVPNDKWSWNDYFAYPSEPGTLPFAWHNVHPYQCAFWYCCHVEWKIWNYMEDLILHNAKIWETTTEQILDIDHFNSMLSFLNLPNVSTIPQDKVHSLDGYKWGRVPTPDELTKMEDEVLHTLPEDFKVYLRQKNPWAIEPVRI